MSLNVHSMNLWISVNRQLEVISPYLVGEGHQITEVVDRHARCVLLGAQTQEGRTPTVQVINLVHTHLLHSRHRLRPVLL